MFHTPRIAPATAAPLALLLGLTPAERLDLISELLEPTAGGPFDNHDHDDEPLMDALRPVIAAYRAAYPALVRSVQPMEAFS
jgi:hypothetical protein